LPKPSRKGISASKRLRQSLKRRQSNRSDKSKTRTLVGKAITLIGADAGTAEESVRAAISGLDRAALKGVIHPNAAARSKSRLLKRFNLATASAVAAAASAAPAKSAAPALEAEKKAPVRRTVLSRAKKEEAAPKKAPATRATKAATPKASSTGTTRAPRAKKST
jgi:small subunit ribosomal protein S20